MTLGGAPVANATVTLHSGLTFANHTEPAEVITAGQDVRVRVQRGTAVKTFTAKSVAD